MDAISYSYADKAQKRIKKFINDPDSTSGVVTVPKVIAVGESVTIPNGRVAVLPNVQVDGTLTVESGGDVFIPTGSTMSQVIPRVTSTDNAIVRFDGTTGAVQNSAITIDDSGNIGTGTQTFNGFGGSGFKNLIINGRKQVNQSGLTTTNNAYNYDNHYKVSNNWFMFIEGLDIESGSQYTLRWEGAATASYYIGTAGSSTINAQSFTAIANGGTITPTITSSQFLWIKFESDSTGSTYNKVQFEKGTVATPFENRLKGMEENLLQRYINVFLTNNISYGLLSSGAATAGATASIPFAFKSRMRTVPSFANLYPAVNYMLTNGQGNITTAVTGFTLNNVSESACVLSITNDGGLTLGQGCNLLSNGSLSTSILFSARP